MKLNIASLFILMNMVLFTSCEKSNDDDDNNQEKTKTELISASVWKYDNAQIDADNNGTGDMNVPAGVIEPCQTDNTLTFNANGSGTMDEGATKCDANVPQTSSFTWSFTSNETVINFTGAVFAGIGGDFKIIALTETDLKLSKVLTIPGSPTPLTVIASFKH